MNEETLYLSLFHIYHLLLNHYIHLHFKKAIINMGPIDFWLAMSVLPKADLSKDGSAWYIKHIQSWIYFLFKLSVRYKNSEFSDKKKIPRQDQSLLKLEFVPLNEEQHEANTQ